MSLKDKVAIVSGATGALGRVVAKSLLENGARVVSPYRTRERQDELVEFVDPLRSGLTGVKADVTNEESVRSLVDQTLQIHGRVDILLNITGAYLGDKTVTQTDERDWDFMLSTNLKSVFLCSKTVLPHMIAQNYGKIVNVAARPAVEKRLRVGASAYTVSKAGVVILTETMAEEVKKYNININCIVPSTIDTPNNRTNMPKVDSSNWVNPEDISRVILYLASDESRVINGAAVLVYGKA